MAQSESTKCRINRLTLAVNNMDAMIAFYSSVFDIHFSKKEMYGGELFAGKLFGIEILFCPAVIAGNTATQNRHQFDCVVPDIHAVINLATAN